MYTKEESLELVTAKSTKAELNLMNKKKETVFFSTYSKKETEVLVNAQSSKTSSVAETRSEKYNDPEYSICPTESNKLVFAESSRIFESKKESLADIVKRTTWKFEEVFALIESCYDPRNFGKVPFRRLAER